MSENPVFTQIIEKSLSSFIRINPIAVEDDVSPTASKFLGIPYIPSLENYPRSSDDRPMMLMAQINFDEISAQGIRLPDYPTTGLLQFFCQADDIWGLDGDMKVIYHETYDLPSLMDDEIDEVLEYAEAPMSQVHRLDFSLAQEYCGFADVQEQTSLYHSQSQWQALSAEEKEAFFEQLLDEDENGFLKIDNGGSKLGGFAFFTQDDIRTYPSDAQGQGQRLLFQIDSNNDTTDDICWGDGGVANWFIRVEDLKNKDFSQVFFNWDCY